MKKAIVRFLLGRGTGKLQVALNKLIRHAITAFGGISLWAGHVTDSDMATLQGAGAILVSVGVSVARELLAPKIATYLAQ